MYTHADSGGGRSTCIDPSGVKTDLHGARCIAYDTVYNLLPFSYSATIRRTPPPGKLPTSAGSWSGDLLAPSSSLESLRPGRGRAGSCSHTW